MTDLNTSRRSLAQLYRRFAGRASALPDACELMSGQVAESAQTSSLHADLQRFSRDLEPATAKLSADLSAAFEKSSSVTHRPMAIPRRAAHSRRRRGMAAIAASLLAVVAVWTTQHDNAPVHQMQATAAAGAKGADRIFTAFDDHAMASRNQHDEIFRGEFRSDEIFRQSHDG